jgi:hypothetical protein
MLKLKIALDPSNRYQMTALSNFAAELAVSQIKAEKEATTVEDPATVTSILEDEAPEKPKKTRARKPAPVSQEAEQGEAAEGEAAEAETESEDVEEAPAPSKITLDDIRRAVAEKKEKHFQHLKFKLKEDFGVSKTTDLAPDQYEAFYNYVNGL